MSTSTALPTHRGLVLLVAAALMLSALVPLVASFPGRRSFRRHRYQRIPDPWASGRQRRICGAVQPVDRSRRRWRLAAAGVERNRIRLRSRNDPGGNDDPAGLLLPPGELRCLLRYCSGRPLPTAPASPTTAASSSRAPPGMIDAAGMSVGSFFREGMPLTPLSTDANQSYEEAPRRRGRARRFGRQRADFTLITPSTPQNSTSPCITSEGPTSPSGSGAADPSSLMPGEMTTLSVTVTPGTNPDSTGLAVVGRPVDHRRLGHPGLR